MRTPTRYLRSRRSTWIAGILILSGTSSVALPLHEDPKFLDAQPPYSGPGHVGSRIVPDATGRILDTFDGSGVALSGWVTIPEFPGENSRAADIWGYVAPSGREYAIIGLENGTGFVEVSDPLNPSIVGFIPGESTIWRDMKTYDEYAYIVHDTPYENQNGGDGLYVADLTRIDEGIVSLITAVTDYDLKTSHNVAVNRSSGFVYLAGSNSRGPDISNGGIIAIDVNVPTDPTFTLDNVWSEQYVHDLVVVNYEEGPYAGHEIAFAACGSHGIFIIDVTDKNNMFTISNVVYPNTTYCHYCWLSEDQSLLYVNDEIDELNDPDVTTTTTYIVNVQDLGDPYYVSSFTNGLPAIDHNPMGRDGLLFEANYRSGLRVWDIRDLGTEQEIAYFDSYPENDDPSFNGAWGVYPDLPSRTILVSDIEKGLFLLNLTVTGTAEWVLSENLILKSRPNPFRSSTQLSFTLARPGQVSIELFGATGQRLATLVDGTLAAGSHAVPWSEGEVGRRTAGGVYFAVLRTPTGRATRRLVLLR